MIVVPSIRQSVSLGRKVQRLEPETLAWSLANPTATPAEVAALDLVIKSIKYSTGVTIASIAANLSTVNGTAFLTNPVFTSTGIPTNDLSWLGGWAVPPKLTLTAAGKTAIAYSKAKGTGETLDTNPFAAFNFTSGWGKQNAFIVDEDTFTSSAAEGRLYKDTSKPSGTLIKFSGIATSSAGNAEIWIGGGAEKTVAANGTIKYATRTGTDSYAYVAATQIATVDVASINMQPVLTPTAKGLTLTSTSGGSTYNFASNDGINPNAASFALTITKD